MLLLRHLATAALILLGAAVVRAAPIEDPLLAARLLTESNFTQTATGAWLVEYFSPGCPVCINFAPTWYAIEQSVDYMRKDPIAPYTLAHVNCEVSLDLCTQQGVRAFPVVMEYFDGRRIDDDVTDRLGSRDFDVLVKHIKEKAAEYREQKQQAGAPQLAATTMVAEPSRQDAPPKLKPLTKLTEMGEAPLTTAADLDAYLGEDRGQGPSFVKCAYAAALQLTQSTRRGARTVSPWQLITRQLRALWPAR